MCERRNGKETEAFSVKRVDYVEYACVEGSVQALIRFLGSLSE